MSRVKLHMPQPLRHTFEMSIRVSDLNYGNHLGNDRVLALVHEARIAFFNDIGLSEMNIGNNTALIMADASIQFKSEGFHGETIIIETAVAEFSNKGFELYHRLYKKESGTDLAMVKTGMVCFDYKSRAILPVPTDFKQMFI